VQQITKSNAVNKKQLPVKGGRRSEKNQWKIGRNNAAFNHDPGVAVGVDADALHAAPPAHGAPIAVAVAAGVAVNPIAVIGLRLAQVPSELRAQRKSEFTN